MTKILYKVWFVDGHTDNVYAFNPLPAVILAQARAIKKAHRYTVETIRNEETGQVWQYTEGKLTPQ